VRHVELSKVNSILSAPNLQHAQRGDGWSLRRQLQGHVLVVDHLDDVAHLGVSAAKSRELN